MERKMYDKETRKFIIKFERAELKILGVTEAKMEGTNNR